MKKRKIRWKDSAGKRSGGGRTASRLSLCMIVKNEAENLPLCLRSVKRVLDEIIVVDTGSGDGTKEIARRLGAKVFDFPWKDDFSAARNESIRHATGDYVLWLDADDRIDAPELDKMRQLKRILPPEKNKAYYLVVNNQSPVDGETRFHHLRIFPRIPGALFEGQVHEQIFHRLHRLGIEDVQTNIEIRHIGYHDPAAIQRKSERNLKIIRQEIAADPENPILYFNAARTLAGVGRVTEAVDHLKIAAEKEKAQRSAKRFTLETSLFLGRLYMDLARYEEAASVLQEMTREFPENALISFCLGECLFLAKDYPGAREALRKSLERPIEVGLFPMNLEKIRFHQRHMLQQCYIETGEFDRAEEMILHSPAPGREEFQRLQSLGLLALQRQNFHEAAEYYGKAIEAGGASDANYANLGLALRKLNRGAEAEEAWGKALALNPQSLEALNNLGRLYQEQGEFGRAIECFQKVLALAPRQLNVRLALSEIYFCLPDLDQVAGQCDALLSDLGLPKDRVLNSLQGLAALYEEIGEALEKQKRQDLSALSHEVSFLISPSARILERIIARAKSSGSLPCALDKIERILRFHGRGSAEFSRIESFLENLLAEGVPGGNSTQVCHGGGR